MIRRSSIAVALIVLSMAACVAAYERSEFLFLDEVRIGMEGVGKTVVAGNEISEFSAEVLGVIDQPGTLSDFIVVRVSGEAIGRSGGIAQGMSGSPITVDGKLIGALSRAASWSKEITPIGLVTPIEPMLAVLDAAADVARHEPDPGATLAGIKLVDGVEPPDPRVAAAAGDTIFSYPVQTPIIASGLNGRAMEILMNGDRAVGRPAGTVADFLPAAWGAEVAGLSAMRLTLLPLSGGTVPGVPNPAPLEAGGAFGVALVTGDLSVGALGTVTYRDEVNLIGFGHPFLSNGGSSFPLTDVTIYDTMKSLEASFKLGTLGAPVGTIDEDRTAAVGGRVGAIADTIELYLGVHDIDRDRADTFAMQVVDEPRLMPELLLASGFEAIDSTLDRVGQGTVTVTYEISGSGMPFPLERRDVFLSSRDIAVYPPWQLASIVSFLQYNEFADPGIDRIAATMDVTSALEGVRIEDLELDGFVYAPGDTIQFRVMLQSFQGDALVKEGEIQIPETLDADYLLVRAYGGPRGLERGEEPVTFQGLGDLIEAIEEIPSYETLTVELFAVDPYSAYADALYGVAEATFEFPSIVVYDEREVSAVLLPPDYNTEEDAADAAPGW